MAMYNVPKPEVSDYYADLGVSQYATVGEIKSAWFKLAKLYHPDKKAPGQTLDAKEFRKIREAYECLKDTSSRARYDALYQHIQAAWAQYREGQDRMRQSQQHARAEDEARRRRAAEQRAAKEEAARCQAREERQRQADERSREAARRARERQEQAARERLRREGEAEREEEAAKQREEERKRRMEERERAAEEARKRREEELQRARLIRERQMEADRRSEEAASKVRAEQEQAARERLKAAEIEEKHEALRKNWASLREAANRGRIGRQHPSSPDQCAHSRSGWAKKRGHTSCVFCGADRKKGGFLCLDCLSVACQNCKTKQCTGS